MEMITNRLHFFLLTVLYLFIITAKAARPDEPGNWTVKDPFEQKVFIENKGQYRIPERLIPANEIFFGASQDGLQYYFTKNSIWIGYMQPVKRTEEEIAAFKKEN